MHPPTSTIPGFGLVLFWCPKKLFVWCIFFGQPGHFKGELGSAQYHPAGREPAWTFLGWFFVTLSMAGLGLQLGDISGSRIESPGIFWVICMERKGLRMNFTLIFDEDFHAHRILTSNSALSRKPLKRFPHPIYWEEKTKHQTLTEKMGVELLR